MKTKKSVSLLFFAVSALLTTIALIAASLFSYFSVDMKYAILLALLQLTSTLISLIGFTLGCFNIPNKEVRGSNTIGLIGNLVIIIYTLIFIISSVF